MISRDQPASISSYQTYRKVSVQERLVLILTWTPIAEMLKIKHLKVTREKERERENERDNVQALWLEFLTEKNFSRGT